jgi:Fe-S cluster assembly protein SufD
VAADRIGTLPELPPEAAALLERIGDRAGLVVTTHGILTFVDLAEAEQTAGVALESARSHPGAEKLLGSVAAEFIASDAPDAYDFLADSFAADAAVLTVPKGVEVRSPVVIVHLLGAAAATSVPAPVPSSGRSGPSGAAAFPRSFVALEEGAAATVIELLVSGDEPLLVLPTVELAVGTGARLSHELVQQLGPLSWQIGRVFSTAGRDATLRSFQASLGSEYARARTDSILTGQGGTAQLLAAYLGDGDQVHDFRTLQEHAAPQTTSDLVFKGAVGGTSRSVYSGMIRMRHGAKRSNAFQTNRNLVLSDGAHADSVPNLDIEENDVRCSHASAVGPIDEEQRFYLESRGVPREAAERLILLGFFGELAERVSPAVRDHLFHSIAGRVRAMTEAAP